MIPKMAPSLAFAATVLVLCSVVTIFIIVAVILINFVRNKKRKPNQRDEGSRIKEMMGRQRMAPIIRRKVLQDELPNDVQAPQEHGQEILVQPQSLPVQSSTTTMTIVTQSPSDAEQELSSGEDSLDVASKPERIYIPSKAEVDELKDENKKDSQLKSFMSSSIVEQADGRQWKRIMITDEAKEEFERLKSMESGSTDLRSDNTLDLTKTPKPVYTPQIEPILVTETIVSEAIDSEGNKHNVGTMMLSAVDKTLNPETDSPGNDNVEQIVDEAWVVT